VPYPGALRVRGSAELARKIERKKMSARDENRHLDVKREINYRMSALIDRYLTHYGNKKLSADRERAFWRVSDPNWVGASYARLTA
jgi:hypothetical protein